jgi:hypothetical protein
MIQEIKDLVHLLIWYGISRQHKKYRISLEYLNIKKLCDNSILDYFYKDDSNVVCDRYNQERDLNLPLLFEIQYIKLERLIM